MAGKVKLSGTLVVPVGEKMHRQIHKAAKAEKLSMAAYTREALSEKMQKEKA